MFSRFKNKYWHLVSSPSQPFTIYVYSCTETSAYVAMLQMRSRNLSSFFLKSSICVASSPIVAWNLSTRGRAQAGGRGMNSSKGNHSPAFPEDYV